MNKGPPNPILNRYFNSFLAVKESMDLFFYIQYYNNPALQIILRCLKLVTYNVYGSKRRIIVAIAKVFELIKILVINVFSV